MMFVFVFVLFYKYTHKISILMIFFFFCILIYCLKLYVWEPEKKVKNTKKQEKFPITPRIFVIYCRVIYCYSSQFLFVPPFKNKKKIKILIKCLSNQFLIRYFDPLYFVSVIWIVICTGMLNKKLFLLFLINNKKSFIHKVFHDYFFFLSHKCRSQSVNTCVTQFFS